MSRKLAVAVVHGIGNQDVDTVERSCDLLRGFCGSQCEDGIVIRAVHWAPAIRAKELELLTSIYQQDSPQKRDIRKLLIEFISDVVTYIPVTKSHSIYESVHQVFAETLHLLAMEAGGDAPLCVISHSFGSVITSNYFYDLEQKFGSKMEQPSQIHSSSTTTPLEEGKTLALFYTLGSPLALFNLAFPNFGTPVTIPSPFLAQFHPLLTGEWVNLYDVDDPIGFPLRRLNQHYHSVVTEDREVNVGRVWENWNVLSHLGYFRDLDVITFIGERLANAWRVINQ